jgi:hypothetical protein
MVGAGCGAIIEAEPGVTAGGQGGATAVTGGGAGGGRLIPIAVNPPIPTPRPPELREQCPEVLPESGTSCTGYSAGLTCYGEYCYSRAALVYCNAPTGTWQQLPVPSCNPPPPSLPCADEMPTPGADCGFEGQTCLYPGCEGPQSSVAECYGSQWLVRYSSGPACNPPPVVPVCPSQTPQAGNACAYEGQTCVYGSCVLQQPALVYDCSYGAWSVQYGDCPPVDPNAADAGATPVPDAG